MTAGGRERGGESDCTEQHGNAGSERSLATTLLPTVGEALLDVIEVAAQLGVCRDTVYKLCDSGEIESFRVRNRIRVRVSALQRYLDRARQGGSR